MSCTHSHTRIPKPQTPNLKPWDSNTQVAEALVSILKPRGAIVVIEAEHLCMAMRGVRKGGARTITSAVRGQLRDPATRAEAMGLITSR